MAQIRCPNCDTIHEMDAALLSATPRRMRCAGCRTIFEATAPDANHSEALEFPEPEEVAVEIDIAGLMAPSPRKTASQESPPVVAAAPPALAPTEDEAAPDPFDFDVIDAGVTDEQDALDPQQGADAAFERVMDAQPEPDAPILVPEEPDPAELAAERRRNRRSAETTALAPPPAGGLKAASPSVILMVCGVWTLVTLGMFRNEIVRIVPATAPAFAAVGLSVGVSELNIAELHSSVATHEGQEALEITGRIINTTRNPLHVPVLRLSLRNASGLEIYVWTSAPEKPELAAGEAFAFTRKLASPPPDARSVMVRFVARDDIVSAIR